jgi:hypothetical protein
VRRANWRTRAYETYFARAILDARSTLHLTYRLAVRTTQFVSVGGAASPGTGVWRLVLPLFALADVLTWLVLRRTDEFLFGWRVLIDAFDVSFWSLSPHPRTHFYDASVLISIPLAIEAGFRWGMRGLVVPVIELAVAGPTRALAGRAANPFTFAWLLIGIGLGIALFSYCRHLNDEAEAERSRQRVADSRRAFLAGQNAVAMGASSVVDSIEGLVPILGRPEPGSALWQLADGWKARLGASTAEAATYLQVSLLEWERRHNRHPDLSGEVELHLDEGAGTTLLTPAQVRSLERSLDLLDLHGPTRIAVPASETRSRPIGSSLFLQVGPHPLLVPADTSAVQRPVDPAPVTYALVAAEFLQAASPAGAHLPWTAVAAGIALCTAAGWRSHRWLRARGAAARRQIVWLAIPVALALNTLMALATRQRVSPDGETSYAGIGLLVFAVLVGMYSAGLERSLAVAVVVAAVVMEGAAVALARAPFTLTSLITSLAWALAPYPTCRHISISLARASEQHTEATRAEDEAAVQAAFRRGQEDVVTLVRQARDDAYRQLARLAPTIPPRLASVATKRLEEVDRRLIAIDGRSASSSSTTTS